jgi:hypothetical protein
MKTKKTKQLEFTSINHILENNIISTIKKKIVAEVEDEYEYVNKIVILGSAGATIELVKQRKNLL